MVANIANALAAYRQSGENAIAGSKKKSDETEGTGAMGSFADTLATFVGDGVQSLKNAETLAAQGAAGKANLQDVIMAVNNAEVMMQTMTSLRDKVIGAYQDIMRMPI